MKTQTLSANLSVNTAADYNVAMQLHRAFQSVFADIHSVIEAVPELLYVKIDGIASVGKHVRHILEFLDALLDQYSTGIVNYDMRTRLERYETQQGARDYMQVLGHKLDKLLLDSKVDVDGELLVQRRLAPDGPFVDLQSSLGDQLAGVVDHATHHLSIINMIAGQYDLKLREGLGVSPATLVHLQSN